VQIHGRAVLTTDNRVNARDMELNNFTNSKRTGVTVSISPYDMWTLCCLYNADTHTDTGKIQEPNNLDRSLMIPGNKPI
jgi:hypothetical protein